jgi:hypothetical protein
MKKINNNRNHNRGKLHSAPTILLAVSLLKLESATCSLCSVLSSLRNGTLECGVDSEEVRDYSRWFWPSELSRKSHVQSPNRNKHEGVWIYV